MSVFDRRPSPVDHTQPSVLHTSWCRLDVRSASRGSVCVSRGLFHSVWHEAGFLHHRVQSRDKSLIKVQYRKRGRNELNITLLMTARTMVRWLTRHASTRAYYNIISVVIQSILYDARSTVLLVAWRQTLSHWNRRRQMIHFGVVTTTTENIGLLHCVLQCIVWVMRIQFHRAKFAAVEHAAA